MPHPLLDAPDTPLDAADYLRSVGTVHATFGDQDSGAVSYGVHADGNWFVKTGPTTSSAHSLRRAIDLHAHVRHPAIVPVLHTFTAAGVPVTVGPWRTGEVLYHPTVKRAGRQLRTGATSPLARFRALPLDDVHAALEAILDAHRVIDAAGYVGVDWYDGCVLYDFTARRVHLIDLDEYRSAPFVLDCARLFGSTRYMPPEHSRRGALVTRAGTVYLLGRTLRLLLDAGDEERAWRGTLAQLAVVERATRRDPAARYSNVSELFAAWTSVAPATLLTSTPSHA
ncbi:serine/threonine protein kinase [Embleya sp. NBC_00896]|uniref:serine/threonine protein kinase n=1 Tax=Embleya sp. NBC_00896 TaxID=2975961 RepID=UPI002F913E22|nr:serine/threonine protein kinase [Embleya sp. NBC_00896]